MKKYIICILVNLLFVGVLTVSNGLALSDPPNMRVSVANTEASNTYLIGAPINLVLILENIDALEIKPYEGFSAQDFRHMLDFAYDDGIVIKSNELESIVYRNNREVPLTDLLFRNGEMLAVETVEFLESRWYWRGEMVANELYSLARPGNILISAKIPIRSYDDIIPETENKALFCDDESRTDCFAGDLESVEIPVCITADLDGDGFYSPCLYGANTELDCDDNDISVNPAALEVTNNFKDDDCNPATADMVNYSEILVKIDKHIVGKGSFPGSGKISLSGVDVNIYDRSSGTCASGYSASWQNYSSIWACPNLLGPETTNIDGEVTFQVPLDGEYILIGRYDPEDNVEGDEIFIGKVKDELLPDEKVYMQIIEKADGKKVPAKNTKRTGSLLLIIQPEYVEWSGTEELYPFIFESIGDWTVGTSVAPPEGFVSDQELLVENVNMEIEAVQFTIVDVGSEWVDTGVTFEVEHKGKKEKIKSKVGIKCAKKLGKKKGFDQFCKEIKKQNKKTK